jgi:hypothetical protein
MGLRPERLPYLQMAGEFLGNLEASDILQRGEPIGRFRTAFRVLERHAGLRG